MTNRTGLKEEPATERIWLPVGSFPGRGVVSPSSSPSATSCVDEGLDTALV